MFFKNRKNKQIQDIEQIPMEECFGKKDDDQPEVRETEGSSIETEDMGTEDMETEHTETEHTETEHTETEHTETEHTETEQTEAEGRRTESSAEEKPEESDETEGEEEEESMILSEEDPQGRKKLSSKQKIGISLGALVLITAGLYFFFFGAPWTKTEDKVYVEKVSAIMDLGSGNGFENRYAGVVESQKTWNIRQNEDKTVKKIYVKEGDTVKIGDKLFEYDNEEAKLNYEQARLELERMENELKSGEAEIHNLEAEKKGVTGSAQLEYTIQIQSQKAENKKTEYEIKSQKAKIKSLKKGTKNSTVKSEMDGIVKKINQSAMSDSDEISMDEGGDDVFMSILGLGDYRVKAMINEQNRYTIEEGKEVIVRSRVNDDESWKGTITKVDLENPEGNSGEDEYIDMNGDPTTTSSKYPFYVKLENSEGLILGQHVYIEPDEGQDDVKDGIWLNSYYIMQDGKNSYVWAETLTKRLEKQKVTLGEYDEKLDQYQIKSGLNEDDYIAFPEKGLEKGMRTTRNEAAKSKKKQEDEKKQDDTMGEEPVPDDALMDEFDDAVDEYDDETDDGYSGEFEIDGADDFYNDEDIWEDEPQNEDGSYGKLERMEVSA